MKTIQYKDLIHRVRELERIQGLGIDLIYKKSKVKIVLGSCLAGLGVITLPIPTGSVFLIAFGLALVSAGGVDLYNIRQEIKRKIKFKIWRLRNGRNI